MRKTFLFMLLVVNAISIAQVTIVPTTNDHFISSLVMHEDTLVIKASDTYLAKSYDWGNSVDVIQNNLPQGVWFSDFPIVDDVYYLRAQQLAPYFGAVIRSKDYGVSWDTLYHTDGYFGSLAVYDSTRMLLGGIGGGRFSVLYPPDFWYEYPPFTGGTFKDAMFLNKDTCFLLGSTFSGISFNGGLNWNNTTPTGFTLEKMQFVGGDTIYAAGASDGLKFEYSYSLGGNTVPVLYDAQGYSIRILDMWFENSVHGYLFGSSRIFPQPYHKCAVFETFDRGLTWTQHQLEHDGVIATAVKANDSIIFLGGGRPLG